MRYEDGVVLQRPWQLNQISSITSAQCCEIFYQMNENRDLPTGASIEVHEEAERLVGVKFSESST